MRNQVVQLIYLNIVVQMKKLYEKCDNYCII